MTKREFYQKALNQKLTVYDKEDLLGRFAYREEQYEIKLDENGDPYLHFKGNTDKPEQPIGLKDYRGLFSETTLHKLDLSSWDFTEVDNIICMFADAFNLENIIVNLDKSYTFKYTDYLFNGCNKLQNRQELISLFLGTNKMNMF